MRHLLLLGGVVALASCGEQVTQPDRPDAVAAPEFAAAGNRWVRRANMPGNERWGLAAARVINAAGQSIVYAVAGHLRGGDRLGTNQAYNVSTDTWSSKADLPAALTRTNGMGVINGKLYLAGGEGGNHDFRKSLYVYNPATNSWARKKDMPSYGVDGVTGVINGKLYVLTGCADDDACDVGGADPLVALYRYNPATNLWTRLATPAHTHALGTGGVIGGKFYVVGGFANPGSFSRRLEVYDPATNAWTTKAPLNHERWQAAGTAAGGKLYLISGNGRTAEGFSEVVPTVSVYDPATNTWTNKAPIPTRRFDVAAAAVRLNPNGQVRVEVVGGAKPPGNNLAYIP
jgi:N-acetylneuraminic acid mutarotase